MRPASKWSRILTFAGLAGMLLGALDPLEGSMVVLPGAGLVAVVTGAVLALIDSVQRRVDEGSR